MQIRLGYMQDLLWCILGCVPCDISGMACNHLIIKIMTSHIISPWLTCINPCIFGQFICWGYMSNSLYIIINNKPFLLRLMHSRLAFGTIETGKQLLCIISWQWQMLATELEKTTSLQKAAYLPCTHGRNTVECRYSAVQYYKILHKWLQELSKNINQMMDPQKTPHNTGFLLWIFEGNWPHYNGTTVYVVSCVSIVERSGRINLWGYHKTEHECAVGCMVVKFVEGHPCCSPKTELLCLDACENQLINFHVVIMGIC